MGEILQSIVEEFRLICLNLFLTFFILKLTSVVTWSWWIVLSPLLVLVGLVLFFIIAAIIIRIKISNGLWEKKKD